MKKLIVLVLAMAFVVAACSSSTEDTVEAYCDDLGELRTSLQSLSALTAQSTVDDVNNAKADVKSAYDNTVSAAGAVDEAAAGEIEDAQNTWQSTVDAIPSDATVEEAMSSITTANDAYMGSLTTTYQKLSCNN